VRLNGCLRPLVRAVPYKIRNKTGIKSMKATRQLAFCLLILLAVVLGASLLPLRKIYAGPPEPKPQPQTQAQKSSTAPAAQGGAVDRGRYLVENVAMCEECHTPRDANGNLDESRRLQGAPIWISPVHPNPNWANNAPPLSGFGDYTDDQGEQILEKGVGPNGLAIRQPMHIYHMNREDALAIIAYLRSLPASYPQH
jgi:hypothetical protein